MNAGAVLVSSLLLSAGGAFAVVQLTKEPPAEQLPGTDTAVLETLQSELRELRESIQELKTKAVSAAPADRSSVVDVASLVREEVARAMEAGGQPGAGVAREADDGEVNLDAVFVELLETNVNPHLNGEVWDRVAKAGKIDELVERFKQRADENPDSPDAHADYGEAISMQLMRADSVMKQAQLGQLQDKAWDQALELDSTHWRARFNKAVGYTFWPSITGKPAEAVTHFQTLMDQQEANPRPGHSGHEQTYLMLGNLYTQQGKLDEAKEVWQRGLRFHPESKQLKSKSGR